MNDLLSQVSAIVYRNILWAYRSPFRLVDVFIWPLVMFFTLSFFLVTIGGNEGFLGVIALTVIGWRSIFFVAFETNAMFVEEHWHRALQDLLVTPISTLKIALGGSITGFLKSILVVILVLTVTNFIYGFQAPDLGKFFFALLFLIIAGFSVGFVLFGLACYFDKRNVFTLSFLVPELLGLLSGPYYPVEEVFPGWFVTILYTFPTTHAFNVIKSIFGLAQPNYTLLILTSVIWVILALIVNRFFYNLGRKKGTLVKVG